MTVAGGARPQHGWLPRGTGTAWLPATMHGGVAADRVPHHCGDQIGDADEVGDEHRGRRVIDLLRRADLLHPAVVHHRDPVGHRQRLFLVVGHVDERDAHLALDPLELDLHRLPELEVERAERLVQQEGARIVDQRPRQRHALLLPARELRRLAVGELRQPDHREQLLAPGEAVSRASTFWLRGPKATLSATVMWGKSA